VFDPVEAQVPSGDGDRLQPEEAPPALLVEVPVIVDQELRVGVVGVTPERGASVVIAEGHGQVAGIVRRERLPDVVGWLLATDAFQEPNRERSGGLLHR
jgi:hypothetical protein